MNPAQPGEESPPPACPPPSYSHANDPVAPDAGRTSTGTLGRHLDASVPPEPAPAAERSRRSALARRRRWRTPALLFAATSLSTYWAGATHWGGSFELESLAQAKAVLEANWRDGLIYMLAVMGILLMHEMGHFVQTLRYRVPASLPLFLPLPVMMGTMGAVIVMDASKADRRQLFDIGLWGPWAGLFLAVPLIWLGIHTAEPDPTAAEFPFGTPLIFKLITAYEWPDLASGALKRNPLFMAGWVGMLVTGLNMLPVSQLDGGHVIYGLFGHRAKWIARAFVVAAIAFIITAEQYNWIVMLVVVLMLGVDHPPTSDDSVPLGPIRWTIGLVSLLIPVFCFTPLIMPPRY